MSQQNTRRVILTAMFGAMVCISTICIQIASPAGGYLNLGDALVLISGFLLGPVHGAAAAGIGSGLADILTGYAYYAPGTIIIKSFAALCAAILRKRMPHILNGRLQLAAAGIPGEVFMVLGYLFDSWFILGQGTGAIAAIPGNCVQAVAGIAIACTLTPIIERQREVQEMLALFRRK